MRNFKLTLEYDGSRYDGYLRMGRDESTNTIENKLLDCINRMVDGNVEINCAMRTETGVHAYGQVINFKANTKMKPFEIKHYMNRYLPGDISVLYVDEVDDRFHATLNAKEKTYVYRIDMGEVMNVFERKYMYYSFKKLNVEAMKESAKYIVGKHDFKKFSTVKKSKSTVKEVKAVDIYEDGESLQITITANDFLHNMARMIVGLLIDIGNDKRTPSSVNEYFEDNNDTLISPPADPKGLFLQNIEY